MKHLITWRYLAWAILLLVFLIHGDYFGLGIIAFLLGCDILRQIYYSRTGGVPPEEAWKTEPLKRGYLDEDGHYREEDLEGKDGS